MIYCVQPVTQLERNSRGYCDEHLAAKRLSGKEAQRRWREANPEKKRAAERHWREANPEKYKEAQRRWREANLDKMAASTAKRQARQGFPDWARKLDCSYIYEMCAYVRLQGHDVVVDHIVPLQGRNVCGLHVPWNLQLISASDNARKHNHFPFDDYEVLYRNEAYEKLGT